MTEAENLHHPSDADDTSGAPIFEVPQRKIVAIEHPCVLLNLDKGLASFGQEPNFHKLLTDTPEPSSIPLWFRPDNPTSKPIVSHHAATNNILLKITVPKRTGRKRKRGSTEPFTGDVDVTDENAVGSEADQISSVSRRDAPKSILRKMQDNAEDYQVEVVGTVRDSHRYRGLADFQFANSSPSFLTKTAEHLLPMKVSKLREFRLATGVATGPGQEIIPPPHFTDKVLGFNYNYEQNPNIRVGGLDEVGELKIMNVQGRKKHSYGYFINHNTFPVPQKPQRQPDASYRIPEDLLNQLRTLMEERPVWTRRAILNRVTGNYTDSLLRVALQLVGYQFRGGPWRDAFVRYGVDPRTDPKFRIYQTLAFKLERNVVGTNKVPWEVVRKDQFKKHVRGNRNSHIWDGKHYSTDGKFWQVCDITDPFLRKIIDQAPLRKECDTGDSGWYYRGMWTKVKMVMKVKMLAMKKGRMGSDNDNPQKPGFLYNSFINSRIEVWPDTTDKPIGLTVEPFLRPMEDPDGKLPRRRPQIKLPADAAGDGLLSGSAGEDLDSWDSEGMFHEDGDILDGDEEGASLGENVWDDELLDEDMDDADEYYGQESDGREYEEYGEYEEEDEDEDEVEQEDDDDIIMDGNPTEYVDD
ncbi:tau 95 subunit of transcription factor TFIIIC [Parahypoxylon ruwenzoriense]